MINPLQCARDIIFCVVRPPKAAGSGQQAAHKEVMSMINTSFLLEQSEPGAGPPMGRRVGEPCEPLLAASVGGRAAWPTARHLADKIGLPFRPQDGR